MILDRFIPPQRPTADSIWIAPPADGSPDPGENDRGERAPSRIGMRDNPAAADCAPRISSSKKSLVFETRARRCAIGEVDAGPVIVARAGKPKIVVLGFHPALSPMRYELARPLLFANLLRWVSPEIFLRSEIGGGSVGTVKLQVDRRHQAAKDVKVTAEDGSPVPFTLRDKTLNFFAGAPGVGARAGGRSRIHVLADAAAVVGQPSGSRRRMPIAAFRASLRCWSVSAICGRGWHCWAAPGLLAEWMLYGRFRMLARLVHLGDAHPAPRWRKEVHR